MHLIWGGAPLDNRSPTPSWPEVVCNIVWLRPQAQVTEEIWILLSSGTIPGPQDFNLPPTSISGSWSYLRVILLLFLPWVLHTFWCSWWISVLIQCFCDKILSFLSKMCCMKQEILRDHYYHCFSVHPIEFYLFGLFAHLGKSSLHKLITIYITV